MELMCLQISTTVMNLEAKDEWDEEAEESEDEEVVESETSKGLVFDSDKEEECVESD